MRFGYFDDAAREYVITEPRTPVKWINYVGTLDFGGFVDHTGGALLCQGDPATNRITRYLALQPASDFRGTTLYLRARRGSGQLLFSPFYVPTLTPLERWECRVGLGFTRIVSLLGGIETSAVFFVPRGERRLVIDITIANRGTDTAEVDAVPVVEYTHFDALKQITNADWVPQTMQSRAAREDGGFIILSQYAFMFRDMRVNFVASSLPASSFETDRRVFLGENEYGTWSAPGSLRQPELPGTEANRGDNIGALMHHLGPLAPGEERRLIVQIGQAHSVAEALPGIRRFREPHGVDIALADLSQTWSTRLARQQVRTPDADADRMLNIHNPRQCHVTLTWSRSLSLYQLGYGARGIGFRDSAQDTMGMLALEPGEARDLLRRLLSVQSAAGFAMHQFNPATMEASMGDAREREDRPQYYSDDHLWAVLAVAEYLKETGDTAFLAERIPFHEKDKSAAPLEDASVRAHLERALAFTRQNTGRHGIPLLGFADWNDTINLAAGAESLFTACLYGAALREMGRLLRFLGDAPAADAYAAWYDEIKAQFRKHAWDGEWYIRYFDADGTPLGSAQSPQGKIYINAQSWPVISGFAEPQQAARALDSLRRLLNTPRGIKISAPGFNGFDPAKGGVTTYPPGAKENCGIFLHANPWVMIAETIMGNGDRAWEYYRQINPAARNDEIEVFECEPWVYPQNILGDEHPQFGLARNSWLSGTASWVYQAATKYILGIRPEHEGLLIDPCIPAAWDGFQVTREFRGARYAISVNNPRHVCRGVTRLSIDGKRTEGALIPPHADGALHAVEAELG